MPNFTWTYDAPSGTYKQHEVSRQVLLASIADTIMMDHVQVRPAFGTGRGESVTLPRISAPVEKTSYVLNELQDIPERAFAMSAIDLVMQEIGSAVPFTGFAKDMSMIDLDNGIRDSLTDELSLALDSLCMNACKLGQYKYAPTGAASATVTTNGTFGAAATSNMNVYHIESIHDILYDTLKCKPARGGNYVGIFRQKSIRGIIDDPGWEVWHVYTDPSAKYNGEVGRIESVRIIPTNHATFGNVGTSSVLGEGVVFGKNAIAMAEARTPELYATPPQGHAGRFHAVSFYGIVKFRLPWEDSANAGECNLIHVGSA